MDKQYYLEYYDLERTHWWFIVREKIIRDALEKNIGGKTGLQILNVGAATGRTSEMLSAYGKVTSIEYDLDCCRLTSERLGIDVIHASVLELPFASDSFDVVCAFDVIEHVEDDLKAVTEMERVCNAGGFIYITVPAYNELWSHHDVVNQHFRRYRMKGILELFKSRKGSILHKTYFNSILFPPIFAFRIVSNLFGRKRNKNESGSDFSIAKKNTILNKVLFKVFLAERYLLKKFTFSFGVSILFLWQKRI
jgi:ubiquinone/menaquinone biosynthesis C-methylase UbiE